MLSDESLRVNHRPSPSCDEKFLQPRVKSGSCSVVVKTKIRSCFRARQGIFLEQGSVIGASFSGHKPDFGAIVSNA